MDRKTFTDHIRDYQKKCVCPSNSLVVVGSYKTIDTAAKELWEFCTRDGISDSGLTLTYFGTTIRLLRSIDILEDELLIMHP